MSFVRARFKIEIRWNMKTRQEVFVDVIFAGKSWFMHEKGSVGKHSMRGSDDAFKCLRWRRLTNKMKCFTDNRSDVVAVITDLKCESRPFS